MSGCTSDIHHFDGSITAFIPIDDGTKVKVSPALTDKTHKHEWRFLVDRPYNMSGKFDPSKPHQRNLHLFLRLPSEILVKSLTVKFHELSKEESPQSSWRQCASNQVVCPGPDNQSPFGVAVACFLVPYIPPSQQEPDGNHL